MKKFFVIATALLIAVASFAQETNKDANGNVQYGPYETNGFWDNWFIGIQGGANMMHDGILAQDGKKANSTFGNGLELGAYVGKWIDPCYGVRIGWQGLVVGQVGDNLWFKNFALFNNYKDNAYNYVHGDFMVNVSNLFGGYKECRTVSFVPYVTAGFVTKDWKIFSGGNRSLALGAGLQIPIRLGNVVSLVPEFQMIALKGDMYGASGLAANASAALGLQFNLGKSNWTRKSTTLAAAAAALAASEAAANALKSQNEKYASDAAAAKAKADALAKENADLKNALAAAEADKGVVATDLAENPVVAYFELGKATLSEKELAHFDYQVKTAIAQNKDQKLTITGTADGKTGSKAVNEKLSKKRADYLYNLLTEKYGLSADNFTVANEVIEGSKSAMDRAAKISK